MKQLYKIVASEPTLSMVAVPDRPAALAGLFPSKEAALAAAREACHQIIAAYPGKVLVAHELRTSLIPGLAYDSFAITRNLDVESERRQSPIRHTIVHEGHTYSRVEYPTLVERHHLKISLVVTPAGFLVESEEDAAAAVPREFEGWSWSTQS